MIVFDLRCAAGAHVFEAWFGSTEDYDGQLARGLVACPVCGDLAVERAPSASHVAVKGNRAGRPGTDGPRDPARMKAMLGTLAEAQSRMLESSTWVGPRFAEEARAIHLGETEHKQIHGQATPEEARGLIDDGVPVAPLPFPVRPPGSDN